MQNTPPSLPFLSHSLSLFSLSLSLSLLQIKSMAQNLQMANKLNGERRFCFTQKYLKDMEVLIGMVSSEIVEKHIKVCS